MRRSTLVMISAVFLGVVLSSILAGQGDMTGRIVAICFTGLVLVAIGLAFDKFIAGGRGGSGGRDGSGWKP